MLAFYTFLPKTKSIKHISLQTVTCKMCCEGRSPQRICHLPTSSSQLCPAFCMLCPRLILINALNTTSKDIHTMITLLPVYVFFGSKQV